MEDTIEDSQPVELYDLVGTYNTYRYTSDNLPHTSGGNTYTPIAGLESSSVKVGTHEDDREELSISMPITTPAALEWAFQNTPPQLEITLSKLDRSGGSAVPIWKGIVGAVTVSKHVATFRCPTRLSNALQANVPTIMVQPQCNHVLFDSRCGISRATHSYTTTVSSILGSQITLASAGSLGDSHFIGGEMLILSSGERRTITGKSGAVVTLAYSLGSLAVSDSVELAAGCDHGWLSANGCPKYSNQPNFGGFPFIPGESKNVFVVGFN